MEPDFKETERIIAAALAEDIGTGDATANLLVPEGATAELAFITRQKLVACGGFVVPRVFAALDKAIRTELLFEEGKRVEAGAKLIVVRGPARAILTGERTALNLLQRMSAVASQTALYVDAVGGTKAKILDTRKTMPGLRVLDKYAVRMGGGHNHRMRLDDGILIKDNHIALCGGVAAAVRMAREGNKAGLPVEVEVDTLDQLQQALDAGATAVLLDNMPPAMLAEAVRLSAGRAVLEASGGVTLETVSAIAQSGVDRISIGALTHSVPNVDIGLDVEIKS